MPRAHRCPATDWKRSAPGKRPGAIVRRWTRLACEGHQAPRFFLRVETGIETNRLVGSGGAILNWKSLKTKEVRIR
jgi:hypothetical protein